MVDSGCLGLKDTFGNVHLSSIKYEEMKTGYNEQMPFEKCDPILACQFIYGAIDYAAQWGFKPNEDWSYSRWFLEPRENVPPTDALEFGKDGMPLYFSGPHDNVSRILMQLDKTAGPGNYHFVVGGPGDEDDDEPEW
jgi:hypothetical protein